MAGSRVVPGRGGTTPSGIVGRAAGVAYLGLGSNLGDRRAHLQAALEELRERGLEVLASSSLYDTEPVGLVLDQPDFLNVCLQVRTPLEPDALLDVCKVTERAVGRAGGGTRHAPRVIDVDVLLLDDREHRSERLTLPHPEVSSRRFVLVPLLELDRDLTLPDGTSLRYALEALGPGQAVTRWGGPLQL